MSEALKIRLLGALVLVALVALAWPFVFDDAEDVLLSKESKIPAKPVVEEWSPNTLAVPDEAKLGWDKANAAPGSGAASAAAQAAGELTFRPQWVVQVASLADHENAEQLVQRLVDDDYRAYSQVIEVEGRAYKQVFIGPKFDKRQADSIKLAVDDRYAVKSVVLPYRPK